MDHILKKYCPRIEFDSYEDFYENFQINLELSYLVNFIDQGTWERSIGGTRGDTYAKQDAWKAQLIFAYTF